MAGWDDVSLIAAALPGAGPSTSWGRPCFKVADRAFVTHRPLSKRDRAQLTELGRTVPGGELALVRVEHELAKEAVLQGEPACFSIPHLDGYPAVLVELEHATPDLLEELVTESFLVCGGVLPAE
ncbi:MAG: MmcQ/YjbR family DNA-binding protein [Solirubrobacteraceae bacterium]